MSTEITGETSGEESSNAPESRSRRLSYKFQRLRERLRSAIASGELAGKLPGERVLARRFKVNAKTLSKALTDLAAEGLLERNIGLGTFVRGTQVPKVQQRCLVLQDPDEAASPLLPLLECDTLAVFTHNDPENLPPSVLNPYRAVVVCSQSIDDQLLRDLVVRGKSIVLVDRVLQPYSTHAVVIDRANAAVSVLRKFARLGHRRVLVIDSQNDAELREAAAAAFPADELSLTFGGLDDLASAVESGTTAVLCSTAESARHALDVCRTNGLSVPGQVSVAAIGRRLETPPCSGDFVTLSDTAAAVRHLLQDATPHRPVTVFLRGEFVDAGTVARARSTQ